MRNRAREVVVTGTGVAATWATTGRRSRAALREGRPRPVRALAPGRRARHAVRARRALPGRPRARAARHRQVPGALHGPGGAPGPACRPARAREARLSPRDMAVVVGSGTGDVETHREVAARLARAEGSRRVSPTVIPRLMASTVPANLATVLGATGPSFTAAAACAGGAYNLLLAAQLIESGHVDAALAGGARSPTSTSTPASTPCARTPRRTTTGPSGPRARTPPTAPASSSRRARASWCSRPGRGRGTGRRASWASSAATGCRRTGRATWWRPRPRGPSSRCAGPSTTRGAAPRTSTTSTPTPRPRRWATCRRCGRCARCSEAPRRLLLDQGLHRPPRLRRRPHRGDLHAGDAPRGLDRSLCQRGAARPGAPRLSPGRAAGVAPAADGALQLVRLRRHERDAGAGGTLEPGRPLTAAAAGCQTPSRNVRVPPASGG